jgi:hypothetical protein
VLEALDTDEPGEALHYANLFSDDDDLNQGLTAEIIRSQHLTERLEFLQVCEPCATVPMSQCRPLWQLVVRLQDVQCTFSVCPCLRKSEMNC